MRREEPQLENKSGRERQPPVDWNNWVADKIGQFPVLGKLKSQKDRPEAKLESDPKISSTPFQISRLKDLLKNKFILGGSLAILSQFGGINSDLLSPAAAATPNRVTAVPAQVSIDLNGSPTTAQITQEIIAQTGLNEPLEKGQVLVINQKNPNQTSQTSNILIQGGVKSNQIGLHR
jgi:hypothetical protein